MPGRLSDLYSAMLKQGGEQPGALSAATSNPLMLAKALRQREANPRQGLASLMNYPQTWGEFGQNLAASYPIDSPEAVRKTAFDMAMNAGPLSTFKFENRGKGAFAVRHEGKEIGTAYVSDNGNYLTSVRIEPEFQNKGIGSRFYDFIESEIGSKLIPSPLFQSPQAKSLWRKRGE